MKFCILLLATIGLNLAHAETKNEVKSNNKMKAEKISTKKNAEDCESKEDLLKKLEEEKKKLKPFSLQGGNTGCSLDKK
jgi:hypothetical protein